MPKQRKPKPKEKEVWLATPFLQPVRDANGNETEMVTPLCVAMRTSEAVRLIKKKKRDVEIDPETQELIAVADYRIATPEEVKAHLAENSKYTARRADAIQKRQVRNAKSFVMVTPDQMQKATGVTPVASTPELVKPQETKAPPPPAKTDTKKELEEAKVEAAAMGIDFPPNIGLEKLREKIEAKKASK